jgi:hypothetical protein
MKGTGKSSLSFRIAMHSVCWGIPLMIGMITVTVDIVHSTSSLPHQNPPVWILIIDNLWMLVPTTCFVVIIINYFQMINFLKETGSLSQPKLRNIISSFSLFNLPPKLQLSLYSFVTLVLWLQFLIFFILSHTILSPFLPLAIANSFLHLQGFFDSLIFGLINSRNIDFEKLNGKLHWILFYILSPFFVLPSIIYRMYIFIKSSRTQSPENQSLIQHET